MHGLLLKVPDEAVANLGADEVCDKHGVEVDALRADDEYLHEPARLAHLEEGQEVHALVVRLLEQRLDPAVVALQTPERVEVSQHAGHHARHGRDGLEEDETAEPLCFGQGLGGHD